MVGAEGAALQTHNACEACLGWTILEYNGSKIEWYRERTSRNISLIVV